MQAIDASADCDLRDFLALTTERLPGAAEPPPADKPAGNTSPAQVQPESQSAQSPAPPTPQERCGSDGLFCHKSSMTFVPLSRCDLSGPQLIDGVWHKIDKAKVIGEHVSALPPR